jgi:acetyl esterase/lipase
VIVPYGSQASQVAELFAPEGKPLGTAVLVHGGFWRAAYDRHLMDDLCHDLAGRDWVAWNLEYRRLGDGGGWPATFEDVEAGIAQIRLGSSEPPGPFVVVGHSAGGHLALWAAARGLATHAVSQAGVTDLAEAARLGLSGGVVHELVSPERYPLASPAAMLPLGVPQLLVHGERDDIVPVHLSRDYHAAAVAVGDAVDLVTLPGVGHYEHLDPGSTPWRAVIEWLP